MCAHRVCLRTPTHWRQMYKHVQKYLELQILILFTNIIYTYAQRVWGGVCPLIYLHRYTGNLIITQTAVKLHWNNRNKRIKDKRKGKLDKRKGKLPEKNA